MNTVEAVDPRNTETRTHVWEGMVDADRLRRYYGQLAGKLARRERRMTVATCLLALVTSGLAINSHPYTLALAILTAVASALPLIYRLGSQITEAAYCGKRLDDLSVDWRELWQQVDDLPRQEAIAQWRMLERTLNEITALKDQVPEDRALSQAAQEEAYAYWKAKAARHATTIARA